MAIITSSATRSVLTLAAIFAALAICTSGAMAAYDQTIDSYQELGGTTINAGQSWLVTSDGYVQSTGGLTIGGKEAWNLYSDGTLTLEGTWNAPSGNLTIGAGHASYPPAADGTLIINGGTLYATGGSNASGNVGTSNAGGSGTILQTGGYAEYANTSTFLPFNLGGTTEGYGTGLYSLSEGASAKFNHHLYVHRNGRVEVRGSDVTVEVVNQMHITGQLAFYMDENGVSAINTGVSTKFYEGATVELDALSGSSMVAGTYTLFNYAGSMFDLAQLQLVLPDGWEGSIVHDGTNKTISASITEVPEPATMGLLGLGLVGLVARRRRK